MLFCGRDEERYVSEWKKGGEGKDVPTCVALHVPRIGLDGGLFPSFDNLGVEIRRTDRRKRRNPSLHQSSAHHRGQVTNKRTHLHVVPMPIRREMLPLQGRVVECDCARDARKHMRSVKVGHVEVLLVVGMSKGIRHLNTSTTLNTSRAFLPFAFLPLKFALPHFKQNSPRV